MALQGRPENGVFSLRQSCERNFKYIFPEEFVLKANSLFVNLYIETSRGKL
jgi:hypothetical protein